MADQARKQSLSTELDSTRACLTTYVAVLRQDLNISARLKSNFTRHRAAWFGAAGVTGLLLSKIPRRKATVTGRAGWNGQAQRAGKAAFALTALKFGLSLAKPAIMGLVTKKILNGAGSNHPAEK